MLKAFVFLSLVHLFSPASCAEWDDVNNDEELGDSSRKAVESSPNTYKFLVYPWQQWNPHFYQPIARNQHAPDGEVGHPLINGDIGGHSGLFRQFGSLESPFFPSSPFSLPSNPSSVPLGPSLLPVSQPDPATQPFDAVIIGSGIRQELVSESCRSLSREMGNCFDSTTCTAIGGRASGSCTNGLVCCINTVNTCDDGLARLGDTVTLNNTYWQSPLRNFATSSSCTLTVKLDSTLPEQNNVAICQVRLDFVVFEISQPDAETVCANDYFDVAGATNVVPTICGFNNGQHMYLHVPPSPTDVQLTFNFGTVDTDVRRWNILIAMIPCNSKLLAPSDCLQYFTARTGTVKTFNWRDVTGTATRQLANQGYSICFRSALTQRQLCLTPCTVVTTQKAFSISVARTVDAAATARPDVSQLGSLNCNNDFLIIPGGFNIGNPAPVANMAFDRYCGERLNALPGSTVSTTVCSMVKPFRIVYHANRDETLTIPTADTATAGNIGFCLSFRI
ncbi:uncharacterized protein LOC130689699 isoform X2 [Daphnia carinata]|uniref:uncharacterized protein LOC130689699 isoform X2 n=1 Tax=Daphnia carinata TaxID=120202 RepID=UPI0025804F2A|nr:uncharacterized protein LOC130689699 isoform X2 [Daphnia carinata]